MAFESDPEHPAATSSIATDAATLLCHPPVIGAKATALPSPQFMRTAMRVVSICVYEFRRLGDGGGTVERRVARLWRRQRCVRPGIPPRTSHLCGEPSCRDERRGRTDRTLVPDRIPRRRRLDEPRAPSIIDETDHQRPTRNARGRPGPEPTSRSSTHRCPPSSARGRRGVAPYMLITDVTPRQYDRLGDDYGHRPDVSGPVGAAKHAWNRRVMQRAERCVAWSSWVATSLINEYGVESSRVRVIPPGVDIERWSAPSRSRAARPRLLFVGADFERKGGHDLLHAFASLPAGSADLTVVTKSAVPSVEGVRVVGDVGPNDPRLVQLFAESDIFVLPSRAEAFGIAAVEASASGLAVVASAVGGLTDIVEDGRTGFTIPPRSPDLLGRAPEDPRRTTRDLGCAGPSCPAARRVALRRGHQRAAALRHSPRMCGIGAPELRNRLISPTHPGRRQCFA